jgi:2-polyprenyl-3-methyl-5-hydroxy-6-metoxy-1,4-benzoquinol methylase
MSTVQNTVEYALQRAPEEYERLRGQARVWEAATGRLLDRIGLAPGARCLDAGSGPGETMRLMAMRVGPEGTVTGIDVDRGLSASAETMLHRAGHRQCRILVHDLGSDEVVPGGPYDLVFARLLLFHTPQQAAVLKRLWEAVAPGGHLLVQDYYLDPAGVAPPAPAADMVNRLLTDTFDAVGCDTRAGMHLPTIFARAGVGEPDGTDVAGRLEPIRTGRLILEGTFRSLLPAAYAHGVTTPEESEKALAALDREIAEDPDRPLLWPLMIGAWKRR